jgi:RimJ/RimL family protein N-acetyltransferase
VGPRSRQRGGAAGLTYGFDVLGLTEIWAEAPAANVASVRILQNLGPTETDRGDAATYLGQPTHYRRFTMGS